MGAWGMTPFDSEDFGDTFAEIAEGPVGKAIYAQAMHHIQEAARDGEPQKMWSAVGIALWAFHTGAIVGEDRVRLSSAAWELLQRLEKNESWMRSWAVPAAFRRVFKEVRAQVVGMDGEDTPLTPYTLHELFGSGRRR